MLFVFLDGVGIGAADPGRNPFLSARLPTLRALLGDRLPTLEEPRLGGERARTFPLDANLGIPGRPQSGTGQTALLTGLNAVERFGRHFGPWTPTGLRPLLAERNVLVRARAGGLRVAFANAYPEGWLERVPTRMQAAPPLAAHAAGVLDRHHVHLHRGEAVASEIVNEGWRNGLGFSSLPRITPVRAGRNLAAVAARHDLTLYAHYHTDRAGHEGTRSAAHRALERVDAFLAGVTEHLDPDTLLLVASDHGNLEELDGKHTDHPVLGLAFHPEPGRVEALQAGGARPLAAITDLAPTILDWIGAPD